MLPSPTGGAWASRASVDLDQQGRKILSTATPIDANCNPDGAYLNEDRFALINASSTRFQGMELATDWRLPHALSARATSSWHDSKFVDFVQSFDGVPTQLAGKRFEMSAKALASAGLTFAPGHGFVAHAGVNYSGDRDLTKRNTALAPAYSTIDAGIGFRTGDLEFRVDGRNLGDRRDAVSESEFGDAQHYRMTARTVQAGIAIRY